MLDFKKIQKKNICLIGLMGSGKSIVGKQLSRDFNIKFYDSDHEIEKEIGLTISKIFSVHGEKFFRDIEKKICLNILEKSNCIISLGGGSIINSEVRDSLDKNSLSIYLKVNIDLLEKRLSNSAKRPLLNNVNKKRTLNKILNERKKYYNKANLIIENNLDRKDVLSEVKNKITKHEEKY